MHTSTAIKTFTANDKATNIKMAIDHVLACSEFELEQSEDGWISGNFYNRYLSSVFQPIFSPIKGKIMGHAAYICSELNGNAVLSPWHIFVLASKDTQLVSLDHLSRVVHALNYFDKVNKLDRLFVGVQLRLLESVKDDHGRAFEKFLSLIDASTSQVAVEIPVEVNRSSELLKRIIINYRSGGYLVAANYSNSSNDWASALGSLYPDIVRIEACDLLRHNAIVDRLVGTIHRFKAALLVRDIETSEQLAAAIRAGADYLQGNFLSKATRGIEMVAPKQLLEEIKTNRWHQHISSIDQRCNKH